MISATPILFRAIIVSLMTVSLSVAMEEGQLLHGLSKFFQRTIPPKKYPMLHKPIYGCVGCMASFWGAVFYTLTAPLLGFNVFEMAYVMMMGVALNFIFVKLS
jgi:hypothetical protein